MGEIRTTPVFSRLVDAWGQRPLYICEEGGARSGKTYAILQFFHILAQSRPGTLVSVVSETMPHLRRGAVRDFEDILQRSGQWDPEAWNKVECIYYYPNGSKMEFFSADQPGKVMGPARDYLFINEGIHLPWEIARQLFIRTRYRSVIDYNPAFAFWAHDHLHTRADCIVQHSTYRDNPFLPPEQVRAIEAQRADEKWWRVYGEGLLGELDGLVYSFEQIDEMPDAAGLRECWGLDFGFTHDPTACVHILADTSRKIIYADEVLYATGLLNTDIAARLQGAGLRRGDTVYADCAEPKSIAEIRQAGISITAADKGAPTKSDKLRYQIQWLQGWALRVTKRSVNTIRELRSYTWATDADGNALNYPIDTNNHALDALRYGAWTHLAGNKGQYNISIR